jgi:hypothetical protein
LDDSNIGDLSAYMTIDVTTAEDKRLPEWSRDHEILAKPEMGKGTAESFIAHPKRRGHVYQTTNDENKLEKNLERA